MSKKYNNTITELINDKLNWNFLQSSIQNEVAIMGYYAETDFPTEYDDYKFIDYLVFYKIDRLYELKKISKNEQELLKELYNIRLELIDKEGELIYDDFHNNTHIHDDERTILHSEILKINKRFAKYNIVLSDGSFSDIKVEEIIDKVIATEDYTNKPSDKELDSFVKSLKK